MMQEILGNVSTILAFNVSSLDATTITREFIVDMGAQTHRIPSDFLLKLTVGQAWCKIGKTVLPLTTSLADQYPDYARAKAIIDRSRMNYGLPEMAKAKPPKLITASSRPFVMVADQTPDPSQVF
jgi:hypothetical protein